MGCSYCRQKNRYCRCQHLAFIVSRHDKNTVKRYFPEAGIRLNYKHKISPQTINAVFDSGSNINLFHSYFGKQLGINVKKGKLRQIQGIGNIKIPTYQHQIEIFVEDFGPFKTTVNFSDYQNFLQIIGRNTFEFFQKVNFKEKAKVLELTK